MTAIQDTAPARDRAARKLPTRNSARDTETWLDALDHLDTAESTILTVLRRMGSEDDWGPEQTTLLAGLEYLNRGADRIRAIKNAAATKRTNRGEVKNTRLIELTPSRLQGKPYKRTIRPLESIE